MPEISYDYVAQVLGGVQDPHAGTDIVAAGWLREVTPGEEDIGVGLVLGYPAGEWAAELEKLAREKLAENGIEARVTVRSEVLSYAVQRNLTPHEGIRNIIAVASGKGGVGKSTTAVNLALALSADGARVGLLDADIYGPSQPRMVGHHGKPDSTDGKTMQPVVRHGIQTMSVGYLIDEETPMIWRGPMVTQALDQLLTHTQWQDLDYLVVDLPPGTGDIQLTLSQKIPVSGAVIVTTPQDIALLDARKGLRMFEKVEVPVLGIVENMSTHICSNCGHEEAIFGSGGGAAMAAQYGVALLGQLPLDISIREQTDSGEPTVVSHPDSPAAKAYRDMARATAAHLALAGARSGVGFPEIEIVDD